MMVSVKLSTTHCVGGEGGVGGVGGAGGMILTWQGVVFTPARLLAVQDSVP